MKPAASLRRIGALVLRHMYLLRKSWPRVISLAYYPTVTMIMWAFITVYLAPTNNVLSDAPVSATGKSNQTGRVDARENANATASSSAGKK